jgi:hypothetical protein
VVFLTLEFLPCCEQHLCCVAIAIQARSAVNTCTIKHRVIIGFHKIHKYLNPILATWQGPFFTRSLTQNKLGSEGEKVYLDLSLEVYFPEHPTRSSKYIP